MRKRYHWLSSVINKNNFTIGAEVGAATGNTTKYLLKYSPSLQKLIIVDLWIPVPNSRQWQRDDMELVFRKKFENEDRISILKGVSWEMASNIKDASLDFVFIDASHDYDSVVKDITAWYPKMKARGFFCGHDINLPGVYKATKEIFGERCKRAKIDNVWYVIV